VCQSLSAFPLQIGKIMRNSFFPWHNSPCWARDSSLSRLHDHTQTHHIRYGSSGRVISLTQRHVHDNKQYSQQTNFHASVGIRNQNPSKRATADPRLRPHTHCDRHYENMHSSNLVKYCSKTLPTAQKTSPLVRQIVFLCLRRITLLFCGSQ
jgi:hypothetical protein